MKRLATILILIGLVASPSLAGLKFVATPDQGSYTAGGSTTGNMTLSVDLDGFPGATSIQFVTGPSLSANPISFSFVAQAGASGPAPAITGTSTNGGGGWNPVIAPSTNTFTAFNFTPQNVAPSVVVGGLTFAIPDITTNGMFDLVASAFALDGADMSSQVIGKVSVVGIPEPSSFLLLGLVGSGIAGVQVWRRRKHSVEGNEPAENETE